MYQQVLDVVPLYQDAHVAWGAAYVCTLLPPNFRSYITMDQLPKAIQEFEAALRIEPNHVNARKYLDAVLHKVW